MSYVTILTTSIEQDMKAENDLILIEVTEDIDFVISEFNKLQNLDKIDSVKIELPSNIYKKSKRKGRVYYLLATNLRKAGWSCRSVINEIYYGPPADYIQIWTPTASFSTRLRERFGFFSTAMVDCSGATEP